MAFATIDLSSISSKIESTVTKSIESLIKCITGHESKGSFIELREQIIANADALWPIVQTKPGEHNASCKVPEFKIIVYGVKSFRAEVIHGREDHPNKRTFLRSDAEDSAEKALGKLLEASMAALNQYHDKRILSGPDDKSMSITGGSIFVPKS